jgi:multicomponent Na+:H+ antiporter subunit D
VLSWFILLPLAALLLANSPVPRWLRRLSLPLAAGLALAQTAAVAGQPEVFRAGTVRWDAVLGLHLAADRLAWVMLLAIALATFVAVLVGDAMVRGERERQHFGSVMLVALTGMNGTVLQTDVFSLYVFLEAVSLASFVLIAFRRDRGGLEGAFTYLLMSAVATLLMLSAVGLLVLTAGGTSFQTVSDALARAPGGATPRLAMTLFVCGLLIKAGVVPFHGWVPGAYAAAPAPVSVFLAGIVTKVAGVYGLIRLVVCVFPPRAAMNEALLLAGAASIVVGALAALGQTDMKRLLAYSSVSQVGYILLGLGGGTKLAIAGAVLHLFNHMLFKGLLFVNAAAVEEHCGHTDLHRLGRLAGRMPVTAATSVIGAMSAAGVPPFSGFWSKLVIVVALWQSGHVGYAVLAAGFSLVTLGYLLDLQRRTFFGPQAEPAAKSAEGSPAVAAAAVLLALLTTAAGVLFPWVFDSFLFPLGGFR